MSRALQMPSIFFRVKADIPIPNFLLQSKKRLQNKCPCMWTGGWGQGERSVPSAHPCDPLSHTSPCTNPPESPEELQRASAEDGDPVIEAEFPLARGVGGKFDNTPETSGRVPGKLKLSPGSNFSGRNLNSCPLAWESSWQRDVQ